MIEDYQLVFIHSPIENTCWYSIHSILQAALNTRLQIEYANKNVRYCNDWKKLTRIQKGRRTADNSYLSCCGKHIVDLISIVFEHVKLMETKALNTLRRSGSKNSCDLLRKIRIAEMKFVKEKFSYNL